MKYYYLIKHKTVGYWRGSWKPGVGAVNDIKLATKFDTKVEAELTVRLALLKWNAELIPSMRWKLKDFKYERHIDNRFKYVTHVEGFTYKCAWESSGVVFKGWRAIVGLGSDFSITGIPCETKLKVIDKYNKLAKELGITITWKGINYDYLKKLHKGSRSSKKFTGVVWET